MNKKHIWEEIENNKEKLAEKIMISQYSLEKVNSGAIPAEYKKKYLQDSIYNLTFLASALSFSNILSFKKYMNWLSELIKNLGIPLEDMLNHFQSMDKVLSEELKDCDLKELKRYIEEGTKTFEKTWLKSESLVKPETYSNDVNIFVDYIINFQREKATEYVMKLLKDGAEIKKIYLDVFSPSLYKIGELWQSHKISVAKEHYATSVIQSIIGMMYPYLFKNDIRNGKTFVGVCSGGELHEIGLRMTADFFEMEAWDTHYLGANLPVEYSMEEIKNIKPDVLGISTTTIPNLPYARELIRRIRECPDILKTIIIVGGRVYEDNEDLWKDVGADAYTPDAQFAVKEAHRLTMGTSR